jgi:hypothetical protein
MTHPSSNDPKSDSSEAQGTPNRPATDRPLPPLPVPARATGSQELPDLPPLPLMPERIGSADKPALPPLPQLSNAPTGLPPLPTPPESEEPENVIKVELPSPAVAKVISIDGSAVVDRAEADEIRVVIPGTVSQEENGEGKPAEEAVVADQPAPALTDEQQFVLSLSPHENLIIIEGCGFLPMSVAMADGVVDQDEEECLDIVQEKFIALFQSGDAATDERFDTQYSNNLKETETLDTFRSKFVAAQDEVETERLVTNFMADFSKVLDKAPESVSVKIKNHIRESCLEVAEASGEGAGANICGAEALVIGELLGLLEIDLDEETHSRIFSSLEEQSETEASKQHLEDQFNEVQKSLLALSDDDFSTVMTGEFLAEVVGWSDSEWDDLEEAAHDRAITEVQRLSLATEALVKTGVAEVDEWFGQLIEERICEMMFKEKWPIDKIVACLRDGETGQAVELLDSLLEKFRAVMEELPAEISHALREEIMESCLEVALASGDGPGRKISRVEAQMMERIFDALGIQLDEETQAKIASSLAALEEKEKAQEKAAQAVQTEDTGPTGPNPNVEFLQSLSDEETGDLFTSVLLTPHLVAAADGRSDLEELQAVLESQSSLGLVFEELIGDVDLETIFEFQESLQLGLNKVVEIAPQLQNSSAVELDRWITNLMDKTQAVFKRAPSDFQDAFRTWIHDACVSIAEASGGEGDDANPISIEERQVIRNVFERLGIEVESKFLRTRLNLDQENQDFASYLESLNHDEKICLLALPHVLVEIVAAADGKIDSQEAMQIVPILKEESAAIDAEFPVIWRENLKEVQQYGKGLSAEFQSLQGSPRKQLEWVFSLLDDYWKILDTMPAELQAKFKTAIANIVTRVAEVSGDGNSVASNIGVEEQLLIDIICESLGIEKSPDDQ